jgi:hypothetical protein
VASRRAAIMAALDRHVEQAVVRVAVNVTAELTATTPVDTGWARANWIPSLRTPASGTGATRQAAGLAEVVAFRIADGKALVTNNVPYIRFLNGGSSKQAPAMFVEQAVAKAVQESKL